MTHHRLPYTDAETPREMAVDAHEVEHNLHLSRRGSDNHPTALLGETPRPATYRVHTRYEVSDDLARLADGLELHFD